MKKFALLITTFSLLLLTSCAVQRGCPTTDRKYFYKAQGYKVPKPSKRQYDCPAESKLRFKRN